MSNLKRIPSKPRFTFARERANQVLVELGIDRFPIDPLAIIQEYEDQITCIKWTDLKNHTPLTDPLNLRHLNTEARILWSPERNRYLLVYDDTQNYSLRVRWSIMHELGHFFLGHLTDFPEVVFGLGEKQYGILEVEANFFAAEMFCPTAVFKYFQHDLPISADFIHDLCLISNEAAAKKYRGLSTPTKRPLSRYDNFLIRNFAHFLIHDAMKGLYENQRVLHTNYLVKCPSCGGCFPKSTHCPYCGLDLKEENSIHEENSYTPFHRVKFPICPVCLSPLSGESECPHCHASLINRCILEGRALPVEYRFCPDCGAPSTFFALYDKTRRYEETVKRSGYFYSHMKEWMEYPYWDFIKSKVSDPKALACLAYSVAYLDDDDCLKVILLKNEDLEDYQDALEAIIQKYDPSITGIEYLPSLSFE